MQNENKVVVYSTPSCVYCKLAKQYFTEKGVKYVEKDVFTDLQAREEMVTKSGQMGVPVIDINGKLIVGFDKTAINELLGL
jgi:glutaredoxin 3